MLMIKHFFAEVEAKIIDIYIQFTYNFNMSTKTFNVSFPKELADQIDRKAKEQFGTRSDFLRYTAIKYLREEQRWDELLSFADELNNDFASRDITNRDIDSALKQLRQEKYAKAKPATPAKNTRRSS